VKKQGWFKYKEVHKSSVNWMGNDKESQTGRPNSLAQNSYATGYWGSGPPGKGLKSRSGRLTPYLRKQQETEAYREKQVQYLFMWCVIL
jgi:hypothetical protein